jgi:protein TonB
MKKAILVLAVIFGCQFGYAQEVKPTSPKAEDNLIYNTAGIDVKPEFPGGFQEFYNYIGKNYKTPSVAGLKGKIFVTFVIEKDGSLSDIKVIRDIGHGTADEAIRVLKECPKWLPGEQNGQKVRVLYSLPIAIQTP